MAYRWQARAIRRNFIITTALSGVFVQSPLAAQTADPASASASARQQATQATPVQQTTPVDQPAEMSDDIVVTAEKRATSAMRTAIGVSVLDADALRDSEVRNVQDLQNYVPGLSVTDGGPTNNVNVRGIGLNVTNPGVYSGVAIYRDNLFQSPIVGNEPYYDIGSVQLLRGPQGTFVGNNSTGGALFINSADPRLDAGTHGYASLRGGTYANLAFEGAINQPLSDTVAVRIATYDERRDSFFENGNAEINPSADTRRTPGSLNILAGRVGVLWEPSADLRVLTKADYYQNSTGGYATKPIPGSPFAQFAPSDPFTLAYSGDVQYDESLWRLSNEIRYTLPGGLTLRNVAGITKYSFQQQADNNGSSQPTANTGLDTREYVISEEFNLISADDQPLTYVVGGYFLYDHGDVPAYIRNYAGIGAATVPTTILDIRSITKKQSAAGFVGLKYKLTDTLQVEASGRYTWSGVDYGDNRLNVYAADASGNPGPLLLTQPIDGRQRDSGATWKVGLNYTPSSRNFFYGFIATGRKGGGIQGPTTNFSPEKVTDYELGWKTTQLNGRFHAQLGAYYNDYSNLQVLGITPATGLQVVFNSGSAETYGAEAQVDMRFGGLLLTAVGSYLHSKVSVSNLVNSASLPDGGAGTLGPQCGSGQTAGCFDYTPYLTSATGPLPYAPKYNFALSAAYDVALGGGTLTPRVEFSRTAAQSTSYLRDAFDRIRDRNLVNLKLSYQLDKYTLEAFVTNLTDQTYPSGRAGFVWFLGPPRQVGARVLFNF